MFFDSFPKILYDSKGDGEVKIVTNLLKRVAVKTKVKTGPSPKVSTFIVHSQPSSVDSQVAI